MKTTLCRLATACLTVILLLSMTVVGSAKQSFSADNPSTSESFQATEGYTVYGIFEDTSDTEIKFFYVDENGVENLQSVTPPATNDISLDANDAFRGFCGLWYCYNGYCIEMNETGLIEITFTGTAFNLGLTLYRAAATGIGQDALITVDGEEHDLPMGTLVCPDGDDLASRMCQPRYFQIAGLEYGEHTVRIRSTGESRLTVEYYEISDMDFEITEPTTTEPKVTEPTVTEPKATEPTTEPKATEPTTTEPKATEPADTDAPTPADDGNGFPWVAVIVGAAVLAVIIVVVIVKKKK